MSGSHYTNIDPESCDIIGDANIFGLGVRLGYYLQFVAAVLCPYLAPHLLSKICLAFASFTLGSFAAVYKHATEQAFIAIEWHVVLVMNMALGYATFYFNPAARVVESLSEHPATASLGLYSGGKLRGSFYAPWGFLELMFSMYYFTSPWMYWKGNYITHKDGCEVHIFISIIFYFWDVNIYDHRWIIAAKIFSVVGAFLGLVSLYFGGIHLLASLAPSTAEEEEELEWSFEYMSYTFLQMVGGGFTIGIAEAIIRRNQVNVSASTLTSTGQLIPLLIGSMTLLVVILSWLQWFFMQRGPWPILDKHQNRISKIADNIETWFIKANHRAQQPPAEQSFNLGNLTTTGDRQQESSSSDGVGFLQQSEDSSHQPIL